jgi:SAM-dependent methyltransferase
MKYDPIKRSLGKVFNASPWLRKVFYRLLDLLLLRAWHIRREIKRWALDKGSGVAVLDAGSGFGQYTWFISSLNPQWRVTGVDVKEEQIADCNHFFGKTNRAGLVTFKKEDLTQYSDPSAYDLILSVDVMEHIEQDREVFENFYASLKPGGMLLISTPSDKGGSDAHDHDHEEEGISGFIDEHVRDGYSPADITEKLESAGFSGVVTNYTYGKPGHLSWKLSMKFPIVVLNVSKLFFVLLPLYYLLVWPLCAWLNWKDVKGQHTQGTGLMVKAYKNN